jgi:hypothetical protein
MKLIYCPECHDLVRLFFEHRTCKCGESGGMYKENGLNAILDGKAIPIGFDNFSFVDVLEFRPKSGDRGKAFAAFVIPEKCKTVEYKGEI